MPCPAAHVPAMSSSLTHLPSGDQLAVDGWSVPLSSPHVKPYELLINVSRLILGPAGTDVHLILRRGPSATDNSCSESSESCSQEQGRKYADANEEQNVLIADKAPGSAQLADEIGEERAMQRGRTTRCVKVKLTRCSTSPIRQALAQKRHLQTMHPPLNEAATALATSPRPINQARGASTADVRAAAGAAAAVRASALASTLSDHSPRANKTRTEGLGGRTSAFAAAEIGSLRPCNISTSAPSSASTAGHSLPANAGGRNQTRPPPSPTAGRVSCGPASVATSNVERGGVGTREEADAMTAALLAAAADSQSSQPQETTWTWQALKCEPRPPNHWHSSRP